MSTQPSERLKDWFAGARARGLWQGPRPYGYRVERGVMSIDEGEAAIVRRLFERYPRVRQSKALADEVNRLGALNTRGSPFDGWQVARVLRSRLYLGELPHRGSFVPGRHPPIISPSVWARANKALAEVSPVRRISIVRDERPLYPLLHDRRGHLMVHLTFERRASRHQYYVPSRTRYGRGTSAADRYRAADLEQAVFAALTAAGYDLPKMNGQYPGALAGAIARIVARIDVDGPEMAISLCSGATITAPAAGQIRSG